MFQTTLRTCALAAALLAAPAWAREGFTNRDFKGDYAFQLNGVLTQSGSLCRDSLRCCSWPPHG